MILLRRSPTDDQSEIGIHLRPEEFLDLIDAMKAVFESAQRTCAATDAEGGVGGNPLKETFCRRMSPLLQPYITPQVTFWLIGRRAVLVAVCSASIHV